MVCNSKYYITCYLVLTCIYQQKVGLLIILRRQKMQLWMNNKTKYLSIGYTFSWMQGKASSGFGMHFKYIIMVHLKGGILMHRFEGNEGNCKILSHDSHNSMNTINELKECIRWGKGKKILLFPFKSNSRIWFILFAF